MYKNTLTLNLEYAGIPQEFELRLSIGSQLKLKKETGEEGVQLLFKALDDLELYVKLLTQALSYKGHQNIITDGAEFYEVLVDNGYSGKEAFMSLLLDLAAVSGMIKPEQADILSEKIERLYSGIFSSFDEVREDEPTQATFRKESTDA